jgi:hypothetical protein
MKNGIKYLIAGLVATGLTVSSSYAVITVTANALNTSFVADNTGSLNYLQGDLVEIGAFSSAPTVGSSSLSNFTAFASSLTGVGPLDGTYSISGTSASAGAFSHAQIYLVVFNAATAGAATQEAIVDVNDTDNATWKFPADADVPNSTTFDLDTLFSAPTSGSTLAVGGQLVYGTVGFDSTGPNAILETQALTIVPEPSTYVLVGTGLLGLLGLRRRRS